MITAIFGYMRRHHLALVALLFAATGTSYAATQLPARSVDTRQLRDGAVVRSKIEKNAVNSAKVENHTLLERDFKEGQLPAGPPGPVNVLYKQNSGPVNVPTNTPTEIVSMSLPPGKWLLTATVVVDDTSTTSSAMADCFLTGTGPSPIPGQGKTFLTPHAGGSEAPQTLTLQAISDSESAGTAVVACTDLVFNGPPLSVSFAAVTATQATAITEGSS
jgi:hypothetical protein